jgi:hypothetical protein
MAEINIEAVSLLRNSERFPVSAGTARPQEPEFLYLTCAS